MIENSTTMGADDIAFFLNEAPGCHFCIGAANPEKDLAHPHHNPRFDFDEDALTIGAEAMIRSALTYLNQ